MFETNDRDDVGAAFDRLWASDLAIPNGLGRHDNDGMFSFYLQTPAGFQIEVGHGARVITDDWDDNRAYDAISAWGHQPLRRRDHRRVDARRRSIVGHRRGRSGRSGRSASCWPSVAGASWSSSNGPSPYPLPRAVHFDHEVGPHPPVVRHRRRAARRIASRPTIYEWRNGAGHDAAAVRSGRRGPVGLAVLVDVQPARARGPADRRGRDGPALEVRRGVRVRRSTSTTTSRSVARSPIRSTDWSRPTVRCRSGRLRRRVRRRQPTVRKLWRSPSTTAGFFYDWLIVDVDAGRAAGVRSDQPAGLRPGPPDHRGVRRSGSTALGVHAPAARDARRAQRGGPGVGAARAVGRAPRQRPARAPRRVHLQRPCTPSSGRSVGCFLAGDAAHQMPPFAGQGMCAGLRDAANLAWKLDLVLGGRAADRAARHLRPERRPSASAAIDFSIELGKVICVPDPAEAAARDEAMAAGVGGEVSDGARPARAHRAGFIHPTARHAGDAARAGRGLDGRLFDDVHGAGWRLVTVDADADRLGRGRACAGSSASAGAVVDVRRSDGLPPPGSTRARHDVRPAATRLLPVRHRRRRRTRPTHPRCARPPPPASDKGIILMKLANLDGRRGPRP